MIPGETILSGAEPAHAFQVIYSNAGFFIGTVGPMGMPNSRESEYFDSRNEAQYVLDNWIEWSGVRNSDTVSEAIRKLRMAYIKGLLENAR